MLAKDFMVHQRFDQLNARYGEENIIPICYMIPQAGKSVNRRRRGGAVSVHSNVKKIFEWR